MVIVETIMLIMEIIGEHADDNGDYGDDYINKKIIAEYVDDTGYYE